MKASLHRIASRLYAEPWLIRRDKHAALIQQFRAAASGRMPGAVTLEMPERARLSMHADMDCLAGVEISHGIAVLPVHGILGKHLDMMDSLCGGYDINLLTAQSIALQQRSDVQTVVLHCNTPGGAAAGVADTARCLLDLGSTKRLVAYVDEACSGGQWLACACDEIYCGESAMLGSISAICAILDESKWFEQEGLKMQVFTDGIHKSAGMEGTTLSKEQADEIQRRIEYIGGEFKSFVKARRPAVDASSMEGQWFYGKEAVALGLADAIAPSLEHVIAQLLD